MSRSAFERTAWAAVAIAFLCVPAAGLAQGTREDYARADELRERTRGKVFRTRVEPHWFAEGDRFWYRNDLAGGAREFVVVDAAAATRRPAFDHARLADALGRATGRPRKANHLPFDRIDVAKDGTVRFEVDGKPWRFDAEAGKVEPGEPLEPAAATSARPDRDPERPRGGRRSSGRSARSLESPDGKRVAFVKDHNLYLRDKGAGEERALTIGGTAADGYEGGLFWSPDSTRLVALKTAKGDDRQVHLIESSPTDRVQPKLHAFHYLKPGDQPEIARPLLFDPAAGREILVEDDLFKNPFSLGEFRWSADSSRFTFLHNERGHQVLRVVAIDAAEGAARAIIDERSETFVDYSQKLFYRTLEDSGEILWMSERDGWNHLYLIDAATGAVKNRVTRGEWVVRGVDRVDEEGRQVWFHAVGIRPGQDPYQVHHARVNFDGTGLVVLTEGDGTHQVEYSPDRKYLVDTYSRVDLPPVIELRGARDGRRILELERADWSALLEAGWRVPERFAAKGRDGKTDIYGVIYRPTTFDPRRKYPVIEQIYAGPHGAFVPKGFSPLHRAQSLAELGFVVVQVDGMGTNWRSKAFHDVCWKDLGDAGLPDRILWLEAAAREDPALDLARVGVYGGSAGGQNALGALLFHPEFYKVGVADCGCHDNRMDKIWWNEAWMGWPIGPHYAEQSNVTNAHKLRGKLLLTVGELDRNVDPASTMQVVAALIKAGKDFDLVVFPGAGHGAGGSRYGERRKRDFFVRHLLGVAPPDRNEDRAAADVAASASGATAARPRADRALGRAGLAPERSAATPDRAVAGSNSPGLRETIERYAADSAALRRSFPMSSSPARLEQTRRFHREQLDSLGSIDFSGLDQPGRVDYVLLRNHLEHALRQLGSRGKSAEEVAPLLPFRATIVGLEEARRRMETADPEKSAEVLDRLNRQVREARKARAGGGRRSEERGREAGGWSGFEGRRQPGRAGGPGLADNLEELVRLLRRI